ncbi:UNVERIFIED_ORG: HTH-type transcriptional regulator/antitoxin HigA [Pantoea allii]|uniref:helix-turn-helix domain-containing protein n=2 Tax=Enterobacter agglomerans TaxID=549 RepID=UPI00057CAC97|nr:helix-turn-helix domain-containing protein [Pantoea agglomerans]KIC86585.1 XRE family transcriptional regulator [Pantoea agglomerans]MBA5702554.1 helix-turn-helix domain-containing protein [Pantoea agglomerans]
MITEAIQATNDLVRIVPFLGGSIDKRDYEQALELVEYLVEHQPDSPLVEILSDKVARYENSAPEFAAFNALTHAMPRGVALLRVIMDQRGLTQSSFADEIGQRSYVSRILRGDRPLTDKHKARLAARFNLPFEAFAE